MPKIGVDILIGVEDSEGVEQVIGGQRDASLNREVATVDATHKQNSGWAYNLAGQGSWSIEADGVVLEDDTSLALLEEKFENKEPVVVYWTNPTGNSYKGDAILTNYPIQAPTNDVVTYSVTFQGQGKYEKVEPTPEG